MKKQLGCLCLMMLCLSSVTNQLYAQENLPDDKQKFTVIGSIKGKGTDTIKFRYVNYLDKYIVDTLLVKGGKFKAEGYIAEPTDVSIIGNDTMINFSQPNSVSIYIEPKVQQVFLKENHYSAAKVQGSFTQRQYDTLRKRWHAISNKYAAYNDSFALAKKAYFKDTGNAVKKKLYYSLGDNKPPIREETQIVTVDFIKDHPASYVSPSVSFLLSNFITIDSAYTLFNSLSPHIRKSQVGRKLAKRLLLKKQNSIGQAAYNFHSVDYSRGPFSLDQLKGKYTLIDFWASWCGPCIKGIPELKAYFEKYSAKGFQVLMISVDRDSMAWRKGVAKQKLGNFYNTLANQDIKAHYLNTKQPIPSQVLLDPTGKIIWKSRGAKKELNLVLQQALDHQ